MLVIQLPQSITPGDIRRSERGRKCIKKLLGRFCILEIWYFPTTHLCNAATSGMSMVQGMGNVVFESFASGTVKHFQGPSFNTRAADKYGEAVFQARIHHMNFARPCKRV